MMGSQSTVPPLKADYEDDFRVVVGYVFNNWTGLKMCIEHGMGGTHDQVRNKLNQLLDLTINGCTKKSMFKEELIDLLEESMDELFNTITQDQSAEEIGHEIHEMYTKWKFGDKQYAYNRIKSLPIQSSIIKTVPRMNITIQSPGSDSDLSEDEEPIEENEDQVPIEGQDEEEEPMDVDDGWTVVTHKR